MAILQIEGSRIGKELRNTTYEFDSHFMRAVEKLTDRQRRELTATDNGK